MGGRFAELREACETHRATHRANCPACIADVDQAQAAMLETVKELAGVDMRDDQTGQEVAGAVLYGVYDHLRTGWEGFQADPECDEDDPADLRAFILGMIDGTQDAMDGVITLRVNP